MATVQRNVKTYGNRNFVAEVASAPSNYAPILSNEVDADFDTIYAAWNGGADTVNVKDGSITFAKLAPDAQLWRDTGTSLTPGTNFASRQIVAVPGDATGASVLLGSGTSKARLQGFTSPNAGSVGIFANRNWLAANAQDDATKSSWGLQFNTGTDNMLVQRSPAGSTTQTNLLGLDATGNLTVPNASVVGTGAMRAMLSSFSTGGYAMLAVNDPFGIVGPAGDATKSSWVIQLETSATLDQIVMRRRAPNAAQGTLTTLHTLDNAGNIGIAGSIATKASGTTWANPSDRRLKDEIADYATGLAAILALQPRTFLYNGKGGSQAGMRGYGFVADEVESVMPETVSTRAGKLDPDDEDETEIETLDQSNLILALVNATKELAARVATLEGAAA